MKKILVVTTPDGFFAQGAMPWSSLDVQKVSSIIEKHGYDVSIVDYDYIKENINAIKNKIIIYTSSQRIEHKNYIEDVIYSLKDDNVLIPSFDSLKAHDNKGFQYILDRKYDLGLIPSNYYADISEIDMDNVKFPCVFKPVNGASSVGVSIVHNVNDIKKRINDIYEFSVLDIKKYTKKYIFRNRYNHEWENYLEFGRKRFILQEFIPNLNHDYKVLIFSNKFYVLKRFVSDGDFRASGSGLHSREFDNELRVVLEKAYEFKKKYKSHIYSLDICVSDNEAFLVEFQFTHVGPVTLTESDFYFTRCDNGDWKKVEEKSDLEVEFSNSILGYINENFAFCS